MDEKKLKNNTIIHKDNSLTRLDLAFFKHIELNECKKVIYLLITTLGSFYKIYVKNRKEVNICQIE